MAVFDINQTEEMTMESLKDFQKATVERIDHLFRTGHRRILVADEVGMGKTLIARGVVVKTARLRQEEGDDLFKIVYICSNISIANQNIRKLKVSKSAKVENVQDTRLSMQHLIITQQDQDESLKERFIQLIPLTPDTSFRLTSGGGSANERALMYAVLRRMKEFSGKREQLYSFMTYNATASWDYWVNEYEDQVCKCEIRSKGEYPANIISQIYEYCQEDNIIELLLEHLRELKSGRTTLSSSRILFKLRIMFARISAGMLEPDLVIMDEFQRFPFMISADKESETGILVHQFIESGDTRILLLSATPYKLYSTLEEIEDLDGVDEHYREFLQVMDFLFQGKEREFHEVWSGYNTALHEMKEGNASILQIKNKAEDAMYQGVCRTERISVMESGDYTDFKGVSKPIKIGEYDIRSYLEMGELLQATSAGFSLPIDYVKSCPYLMSYMKDYKVKEAIETYFKSNPEHIHEAERSLLWVNPNRINDYRPLLKTNARLEKLKEIAFENHAEMYLWIPPSRPYYGLRGVYRNSALFSKVLVFSSWQMVPRMIGTMISYEAERLTVGKLGETADIREKKNTKYYARRRYPYKRLTFTLKQEEPQRMTLFCLLYPSRTLADLYDPIQSMNSTDSEKTLTEIERDLRIQIRGKLEALRLYQKNTSGQEDAKWYYMAPVLMDGKEFASEWIDLFKDIIKNESKNQEEDTFAEPGERRKKTVKAISAHIDYFSELMDFVNSPKRPDLPAEPFLGRQPEDLEDTLINMVLGSPAVCIYRSNGQNARFATELARTFIDYFNTTESTAVIELASELHHARSADDNAHWQDVLLYCKDGCFQAMFDEYRHLVSESFVFSPPDKREQQIQDYMKMNLRIHTATYEVDTFRNFRSRVYGEKNRNLMRAHYAVGFVNSDGADNQKNALRKDNVRGAFNSPLKPFVLATTSIGQEGLDFHNYCRRVMHWNLPANPIDLEQREGRVNRYKCLAIRQNVADKYGTIHFEIDPWKEMFRAAEAERDTTQSELVPYWCFGKNQKVKIERIVPMYPMSKDEISYERLIKILSLYRLTLGQARQEELLEYLFNEIEHPEELKKLFIDLSPFSKENRKEL